MFVLQVKCMNHWENFVISTNFCWGFRRNDHNKQKCFLPAVWDCFAVELAIFECGALAKSELKN